MISRDVLCQVKILLEKYGSKTWFDFGIEYPGYKY